MNSALSLSLHLMETRHKIPDILKGLPVGYCFSPTDDELVQYLNMKKNGDPKANIIEEFNIFADSPNELERYFRRGEENEWYFFTKPTPLHSSGSRKNRRAGNGFWRDNTGKKAITVGNENIGSKMTMTFHVGKRKTSWKIQEYCLPLSNSSGMRKRKVMDNLVLCKIYKRQASHNPIENLQNEETSMSSIVNDQVVTEISPSSWQTPTIVGDNLPQPSLQDPNLGDFPQWIRDLLLAE